MIRETYFKEDKAAIEIKTLFKGSKLIPFFGSGFTKGCRAKNGRLPDAKQLIEGIKSIAIKSENLTKNDIDEIKKIDSLKNAVLLFKHNEIIPKKSAQTFFTNIFYNTQINEESKIRLLNLDWPHIFSFNIDDGIERVAGNYSIIKPNRKTSLEYIHSHRCLFKIHGDIREYVSTEDEELIFTWREYIDSLEKNKAILNFMASESQQSAFLFIGCSLDNEIDLMSLSKKIHFQDQFL